MAKRSAPPSAAEPSTKKPKSASGSKPTSNTKSKSKAKPTADVTSSPLDTVKQAASDLINTVSEAVGVAGDLLYDDGNTPAPVSQVVKENVDVPALKKKGKAAKEKATEAASSVQDKVVETAKPLKGKAAKAAKDAQEAVEATVEEKTGVDVKAVKGKAAKAAKAAKGKVDAAVEAVEPEVEKAVEAAKDPKNRKRAEDFITQAEETVMKVVGDVATKIGEVATGIVDQFGEASGLASDIEDQTQKGKKKAKAVVEEGKKEVTKKGKQAKEVANGVKEQATKKGKEAVEKAAPVVEEGKKQAAKKGKQAKEAVDDVKEKAGKKGKQAQEVAVEVEEKAAKKGKQAQKAAEEVVETGKRKAKSAVEAAEPTTKKVKAAAEPTAKKVKAAAEPVVEKGKKVAKETTTSAKGTAAKATKAVVDAAEEVVGEDEDVEMGGFSSSDGDADSSDDESDAEDLAVAEAGRKIDMSTLPSVAKDDKSVQARLKKASKKKDEPKGTLFVGRIPHGFYEEQMKEYFSQFGDISRVRLARNSKTGASKHYAYIEISSTSVAEIVAETMDNYLLMGHLLRVNVIPQEQVHPQLWVGANKKFRKVPRARVEQQKHDKPRTDEQKTRANEKVIKKQTARKQKIKDAGIDYEFEGHA